MLTHDKNCLCVTVLCIIIRILNNNNNMYAGCCCLSNAMHGQDINLPVCVCVCVCYTFSVNSPQRIFTVDSLKDAHVCKDVHFGGLDDE